MPWNKRTEFHQRLRFIQQIQGPHACVVRLCHRWNISRKTAYKWLERYRKKGWRGLQNQPPVARKHPQQIGGKWRRRVRQMRRRHRTWGPRKLHQRLKVLYGEIGLPSSSTMGRWLRLWGMVQRRRVRRPQGPKVKRPPRGALKGPNDVWTADFKGWFRLGNGRRVEPLTVRDSHSRYTLAVHLMEQQNIAESLPVFRGLFRRYGLPKRIRVDNGSPFGSKGPRGLTRLSVWWIKQGIEVEFGRAAHPEDNAAHEQFHRVMKAETASPPAHTWRGQQRRTARWIRQYNQDRPHEALKMRVPEQLYRPSSRKLSEQRKALRYPRGWESRQVKSNGEVSWRGTVRFIGEAFAGERIGLKRQRTAVWQVYFCKIFIGELREKETGGMRPVVYGRERRK